MEIIKVYLKAVPDTAVEVKSFAVTDWYAKPKVLHSLAYKIYELTNERCLYGSACVVQLLQRYERI